ncbi:hypothetical protein F5Y04DRAFT_245181 [Hypomontagnella monticulosa]|nr:hypothetical protein F5Y04DRAFT_245181 [Hypomontagnella monticulosa]
MASPYADRIITIFDGALSIRCMVDSDKDFAFEATFITDHPSFAQFRSGKPPLHFHPHQEEYISVVEGVVALEVEGREYILGPDDGEFLVKPWIIHRLYTVSASSRGEQESDSNIVRFKSAGQKTPEVLKLDLLFFENWYGYQDEALRNGGKIDMIQTMCMFDAGGSYILLPSWVPFRRTTSYIVGVIVGRWLGTLLGYQPYYRQWSTDWHLACEKMDGSFFYRKWAKESKFE